MQSYNLTLLIDKNFDSINRVMNKFCGRGFIIEQIQINPAANERTAFFTMLLKCDLKSLEIITRKILNYVDVHRLIELSEKKLLNVV